MKLFKLTFTLVLSLMFFGVASAQLTVNDDNFHGSKATNTPALPAPNANLDKAFYEGWKFPINAISSAGGNFQRYVDFIFEDSIVQFVSNQSTFNVGFHVIGGVMDPTDPNWELEGDAVKFTRFNGYTVDSFMMPYLYVRYVDSIDLGAGNVEVVDTVIFKFYDYEELNYWSYNRDGATNIFGMPIDFSRAAMGSPATSYEVKIPLTKLDSTNVSDQGWGTKLLALDLNVIIPDDAKFERSRKNICGFSVAFKTMLPYADGDTLIARDGITPSKRLNYFGYSLWLNEGSHVAQTEAYNNSFFTNSEFLYGGEFSNLKGYIPSSLWNTPRYVWYGMKIQTNTLSIDNVNDNMSIVVYPNPVSRFETLKLDFNLVNADNVVIEMYDLLGNKVKEVANGYYPAGENQIDVDITDLASGVYTYSVRAGQTVTSKKITITE